MSYQEIPRIHSVRIKNYRALKDFELKNITPLTVLLGPNGSGKSTVFDVFAFLSECFNDGLRRAWDRRGRFKELRTRDSEGPIEIEIKYREKPRSTPITYMLEIVEEPKGPVVSKEVLKWRRGRNYGQPYNILSFQHGSGEVISGDEPEEQDIRIKEKLTSPDMLAVNTLGQLAKHPRVGALRQFITGWHLSYLSVDNTRGIPEAGPEERLSKTGDNLPNVIQYLSEQFPEQLQGIIDDLVKRVPQLESINAEILADGRLLLQIKDAPFSRPVLSKYASDGTLKMLAYLVLLFDPVPPQLIGIEEPENHLHPRLLPQLAEECRQASEHSQVMVTTHSPFFVNGLRAEDLWVLYRDNQGHTKARQASQMVGIKEFMEQGALLGHLWMENLFEVGDPLSPMKRTRNPRLRKRTN